MILAPLRGVTIRAFREVFAGAIAEAGFTEAFTPFIPAMAGVDPRKDRELRAGSLELRAKSLELGAESLELRAESLELRAESLELRAESLEQGAGSLEQGAGSLEQGAGSLELGAKSLELGDGGAGIRVTPQFIGKDPAALKSCLEKVKEAGYETADLNCGCPFPMVRNKGRGSGILRTPEVLERMLAAGCEAMGPGRFSIKARLGVDRPDELLKLMPIINRYPLRFLTVHGRVARQMYEGTVDTAAVEAVVAAARVPVVLNGDLPLPSPEVDRRVTDGLMVGRAFIRALGERGDIGELLNRYIERSAAELCGERPVLGRMKELVAYWKDSPRWRGRWNVIKICRTVSELESCLN